MVACSVSVWPLSSSSLSSDRVFRLVARVVVVLAVAVAALAVEADVAFADLVVVAVAVTVSFALAFAAPFAAARARVIRFGGLATSIVHELLKKR